MKTDTLVSFGVSAWLIMKLGRTLGDFGKEYIPDAAFSWLWPDKYRFNEVLAYCYTYKQVTLGRIPPANYAGVPAELAEEFNQFFGAVVDYMEAHQPFYGLLVRASVLVAYEDEGPGAQLTKAEANSLVEYVRAAFGHTGWPSSVDYNG